VLVDVALVQVSPPDALGLCSLGVAVDATKAAVENAELVIAQVNRHMPVTLGDSFVSAESIDYMVEGHEPLTEFYSTEPDPISLTIGRHIAGLISDGATLHFEPGPISAATMRYLDTKKDLGIHTDLFTDDILRLIKSRAVTNRVKTLNKGKSVATMVLGTHELYDEVDHNPYVEIHPIDYVCNPAVIAQYDHMVSVHSVQEMELTGMARGAKEEIQASGHLPSSMSFIDGARRSKAGFSILALPSTSADGKTSRIVPRSTGKGLFFSRAKVDYVVTEYGVVNLFGLSIRERAIALIHIAHPKFREELLEEAKQLKYVGPEQVVPPEAGSVYPDQYEFTHAFGETEIFFRPMRPCDARRIQRMFYSLSPKAKRMRYHGTIKALSNATAQRIAAVDYSQDMAIVGLVGKARNRQIVAEGRYTYNPANNMGEFDIVVNEDWQGRGIATFLANYLSKVAYARGLSGVYAFVISQNEATIALLNKAWPTAMRHFEDGACTFMLRFPKEDIERPKDSIIVYSAGMGDYSYGVDHPFNPERARYALQLIERQSCLDEPWMRVATPPKISKNVLIQSHNPDFIDALEKITHGKWDEDYLKYGVGTEECPAFPGLFDYVMLYCAATIAGVDLITEENANVVFNPLGGFHHASRSAAEGFCYVNDIVVAIDLLLARGHRVAYVDIDAHHGNGVQDTYYSDDRVLTVSLHESGKTLFPWGGFETEIGEGIGTGFNINVPLPQETDDDAYVKVFRRVVTPAVKRFSPTVVVTVMGADTHRSDPLANLSLTNNGMVEVMKEIRNYSYHLLLLGGGGYDMHATTRAWCRMWAAANRIDSLPDYLLVLGGTFLASDGLDGADIVDMPFQVTGSKKQAIDEELGRIADYHEANTIPLIGKLREDAERRV
jgi:acetoin utilization deacetylase AcuC-like enzyme/GNAT superfamily N-acetyltransferase